MIDVSTLLQIIGLGIAAYFCSLVKKALDLYEHQNFSNYKSYTKAVQDGERKPWRPLRKQDEQGIHRIVGDRQKISTKGPNGITHTSDAMIPLHEADPEKVMAAIDDELGYTKVEDNE